MDPMRKILADWTQEVPESEIRRLLKSKTKYYLAGGLPGNLPTKIFPEILRELADYYDSDEQNVINEFQYGPTAGIPSLRKVLAERIRRRDKIDYISGAEDWEKILITTGSQQAIYIALDILINPGDIVVTPSPAYLGFVTAIVKKRGHVVTAPTDSEGLIPEYVEDTIIKAEKKFGRKVKILYVVEDSDNPKGTTLPFRRREQLYNIAEEHDVIILSDSAYKEMQFEERIPSLKTLDKDNSRVIYASSSSKEAAPLRIGYTFMPDRLHYEAEKSKGYLDLCTPTITQRIAELYYVKYIDKELPTILQKYKRQKEAAYNALLDTFPEGEYTNPTGGFFIWWQPKDEKALTFDVNKFNQEILLPNEILVVPGSAFYPPSGHSYDPEARKIEHLKVIRGGMRIGYSLLPKEMIDVGVRKLGKLLSENL
ncbi:MAG: PLP-dependent aminotransferase family protein [Asgard group archaeon]|nr:PLP-dependent aminotransferase family protein [Asgard group archaeon]